jgi:5-formyltetrahydrofolate cyclo-ligase
MENKSDLRKRILNIRNSMDKKESSEKSAVIMEKLTDMDIYKKAQVVFVYMDFNHEVETMSLIKKMLLEKKKVVIPYTDTVNTVIIPSELKSIDEDLVKSKFGYYEPAPEKIVPVKSEEFDLVVVPGVVFDKGFNRIGFGKGYYDRILSTLKESAKAVAVAYDFQVLEQVPSEEHDVKMDMIITEKHIYN